MNVLQIGKYYYPEVGGVEQVVRTIAEGLNGPNFTMQVLASCPRGTGHSETINGVRVRKAGSFGTLSSVPVTPLFPLELAAASRDADVLHFHLPNPLAVISYLTMGPSSPEVVVTYHSDIVRQTQALKFYRPLLHRFLDCADQLVTTSPRLLEHSSHLPQYASKCSVVPLSIDVNSFDAEHNPSPDIFSSLESIPTISTTAISNKPTILFVGRLSYYKGVRYLLDAIKGVDATLLIVGDGDRREALEHQADDQSLSNVVFLGQVSDETLKACYSIADMFVLPSIASSEAFGVVQLEAMASKLPVINTALPTGVPWVSLDGKTGLTVPPADADALANAIEKLLGDRGLCQQYGENGRQRVERLFNRKTMLESMADIYRDLN